MFTAISPNPRAGLFRLTQPAPEKPRLLLLSWRKAPSQWQLKAVSIQDEAFAHNSSLPGDQPLPGSPDPSSEKPASTSKVELDEAEVTRRKKISEANSGRVPWNKGRKHSPETIAKIKAKTAEAMARPEIIQNFKDAMEKRVQLHSEETRAKISAKVRAHNEARRIAEGKPPKPEKVPKPKRERKPKPSKQLADDQTPQDGTGASSSKEVDTPKRTRTQRSTTRSRRTAEESDGSVVSTTRAPRERKKRESNSSEHKESIRAAIKKKWEDPEFREYMVQKMKESAARRQAEASEKSGSTRKRPSSSGIGKSTTTRDELSAAKQKQVWLDQVQVMVSQLLNSRKLLETMDQKIEAMKQQASAFVNDPVMLDRLTLLMAQVEARRQELAEKVAEQQAKIPPNVGFDHQSRVFLKPQHQVWSSAVGEQPSASESKPDSSALETPAEPSQDDGQSFSTSSDQLPPDSLVLNRRGAGTSLGMGEVDIRVGDRLWELGRQAAAF